MSDSAGVIAYQKFLDSRGSGEDELVRAGISLPDFPAGTIRYHVLIFPPHAREIRGHHRARCLVSLHDQTRTGNRLPVTVGSIFRRPVSAGTAVTDVPLPDATVFPDHRSSQSRTV